MGVWIETQLIAYGDALIESHPVWVCGLKLLTNGFPLERVGHTLYGCVD